MWIKVTDSDGKKSAINTDHYKAYKGFNDEITTLTDHNDKQVRVRTSEKEIDDQIFGAGPPISFVKHEEVELPEPIKAPTVKIGTTEPVAKIFDKLTKGGTTSAALG